jgi:hypothetical protein
MLVAKESASLGVDFSRFNPAMARENWPPFSVLLLFELTWSEAAD